MHWPYKQHKTSRNQKLFPYHEELKKTGASFGVSSGYERPLWFALNNEKPEFKYNYNYQNWYPAVEFETKNARKNVGLFDLTAFSKYDLKGQKTHSELQKICTANVKDEIGKTTYTQMLNENGGIETDLTVVPVITRISTPTFSVTTPVSGFRVVPNFPVTRPCTGQASLPFILAKFPVVARFCSARIRASSSSRFFMASLSV